MKKKNVNRFFLSVLMVLTFMVIIAPSEKDELIASNTVKDPKISMVIIALSEKDELMACNIVKNPKISNVCMIINGEEGYVKITASMSYKGWEPISFTFAIEESPLALKTPDRNIKSIVSFAINKKTGKVEISGSPKAKALLYTMLKKKLKTESRPDVKRGYGIAFAELHTDLNKPAEHVKFRMDISKLPMSESPIRSMVIDVKIQNGKLIEVHLDFWGSGGTSWAIWGRIHPGDHKVYLDTGDHFVMLSKEIKAIKLGIAKSKLDEKQLEVANLLLKAMEIKLESEKERKKERKKKFEERFGVE
jgi:hypothetical protein